MLSFNQSRSHSLEQSLKEGYAQMADLNLSLATEA
ncbi:antitoxin MazE, partial [Staphylococcus aureus]|nr:antitoxin MazE [Staphylococcus aureus]